MKIEILYEEIASLYGDRGNISLIKQTFPKDTIIETSFTDTPRWVSEDVDFIYMGSTSENWQKKIIEKWHPYKERLKELMDNGTYMLFTGNSYEIFGSYIEFNSYKYTALDLLPFYTITNNKRRINCIVIGRYGEETILGHKTLFSESYSDSDQCFVSVSKGMGRNKQDDRDGIIYNNFIGTAITGPLLVMNPDFTQSLFNKFSGQEYSIPNIHGLKLAYDKLYKDLEETKVIYY